MKGNRIEDIKDICRSASRTLLEASEKQISPKTICIDCEQLEDFNHIDIRKVDSYSEIFNQLESIKGPALYWFEIISESDNNSIYSKLNQYRNSENCKATPALKEFCDPNTKVLYVGKAKNKLWGRFIQHLGYYKVPATQGLQLYHWTKGLSLKLNFHVYEFDKDMENIMGLLELEMSKKLKPLIGKHK